MIARRTALLCRLIVLIGFLLSNREVDAQTRVIHFDELAHLIMPHGDTVVVANFWASWCGPCLQEMPDIVATAKKYQARTVKFLLVSLDFVKERETKLEPLLKRKHWGLPVVLLDEPDYNSWIPQITPNWEGNIPATLVASPKNRIFIDHQLKGDELAAAIDKVAGKKP